MILMILITTLINYKIKANIYKTTINKARIWKIINQMIQRNSILNLLKCKLPYFKIYLSLEMMAKLQNFNFIK